MMGDSVPRSSQRLGVQIGCSTSAAAHVDPIGGEPESLAETGKVATPAVATTA